MICTDKFHSCVFRGIPCILPILLLVSIFSAPLATAAGDNVQFVEVARDSGVDFVHECGASSKKLLVETFASGVAWLDYDNDGWLDLYFQNGANLSKGLPSPGNALYRNTGKGTFVDVSVEAGVKGNGGYATGVAIGDYDNDGFLDIFVNYYGPNLLYQNKGDGTFRDVTVAAGVGGGKLYGSSAGFLDYDRDGDLDLYVSNSFDFEVEEDLYCGFKQEGWRMYCHPSHFDGVPDLLYRNNGDGTFTDVSSEAGITNPGGKGLGITFGDFDGDGFPDIYVGNDGVRNSLFRNNGDGTFEDLSYSAGVGFDANGKPDATMGTTAGDFDGDGFLDLYMTHFSEELNALYRNQGNLEFEILSDRWDLGTSFSKLAFGTGFLDFDNDGDLDIYASCGHVVDNVELYSPHIESQQSDLLYENRKGAFRDVSASSGPAFEIKHFGRGAAIGDYDNDGDLDIVVNNFGQPAMLFRNDGGNRNHWIMIQAQGKKSNRFGFGTRIQIRTGKHTQLKEVNNAGSYLSSHDFRVHFGLGDARRVDRIEVLWPSGQKQTLTDVPADQILLITEE